MQLVHSFMSSAAGAASESFALEYTPQNLYLYDVSNQRFVFTDDSAAGTSRITSASVTAEGRTVVNVTKELTANVHKLLGAFQLADDSAVNMAGVFGNSPVSLVLSDGQKGSSCNINVAFADLSASQAYRLYTLPNARFSKFFSVTEESILPNTTKKIDVGVLSVFDFPNAASPGQSAVIQRVNGFTNSYQNEIDLVAGLSLEQGVQFGAGDYNFLTALNNPALKGCVKGVDKIVVTNQSDLTISYSRVVGAFPNLF